MRIVIIPGTNRIGSLSVRLATIVAEHYRKHAQDVDVLELTLGADFLEPDAYSKPKPAVTALVSRFLAADGVVFIVPEYNGSYPGILKLFIDMLPYPQGFDRRPCAFVGIAAGQFQSLRAVEHLQGVAGYRHAYIFPNRVFIGDSRKLFTPEGTVADAKLLERLQAQAAAFVEFVAALKRPANLATPTTSG
jgi:chromate reductase, NAD(P)H dehydrogenase (quinone)